MDHVQPRSKSLIANSFKSYPGQVSQIPKLRFSTNLVIYNQDFPLFTSMRWPQVIFLYRGRIASHGGVLRICIEPTHEQFTVLLWVSHGKQIHGKYPGFWERETDIKPIRLVRTEVIHPMAHRLFHRILIPIKCLFNRGFGGKSTDCLANMRKIYKCWWFPHLSPPFLRRNLGLSATVYHQCPLYRRLNLGGAYRPSRVSGAVAAWQPALNEMWTGHR